MQNLPDEMILQICSNMDIQTLVKTAKSSKRLNAICGEILAKRRKELEFNPIWTGRYNSYGQRILLDDVGEFIVTSTGLKNYNIENPDIEYEEYEEERIPPDRIEELEQTPILRTNRIDSQGRTIFQDARGLFVVMSDGRKSYISKKF